jgi:hypothetical protein
MSSIGGVGHVTPDLTQLQEEQQAPTPTPEAGTSQAGRAAESEKQSYQPSTSQATDQAGGSGLAATQQERFEAFQRRNLDFLQAGEQGAPTEVPPPANETRPLPRYGRHETHPTTNPADDPALQPGPPTNPVRRLFSQPSQATLRSRASSSSLQSNASRVNLAGSQGAADVPPVPPLPPSVARPQASSSRGMLQGGQGASGAPPVPSLPPAYGEHDQLSGVGQSTQAAPQPSASGSRGLGRQISSFFSRGSSDPAQKQLERNGRLREAIEKGDQTALNRRLDKTNPTPNPAAPSAVNNQNAFHKLANSGHSFPTAVINKMFEKTPVGHLAPAAMQQDAKGNTPLHYVEKRLGSATAARRPDQDQVGRLSHLGARLRHAAAAANQPLEGVQNADGHTPAQMREEGRREQEATAQLEDSLRQSNML